jgi:hypothetical protein
MSLVGKECPPDDVPVYRDYVSRHLFEFEGFNIGRMKRVDGGWRLLTRELAVYKDPKTHEILEHWKNPLTDELCEVVHVLNDPVNQEFLLRGPRGSFKVSVSCRRHIFLCLMRV